jgi:glycerol-3-phosphate responsive antiterminator
MKERLEDLDYADDICLLAQKVCDMEEKLKRIKEEAELVVLHINIKKTRGVRIHLICKNLG